MPLILTSKDFLAGLMYIAFGAAVIYWGAEYSVGVAGRMGPGYFPLLIGSGLLIIGTISLVRSMFSQPTRVGSMSMRALILITLSVVLFAFFLQRLGLVISLALLLTVAALASRDARLSVVGVASAVGLIAFCALVFVKGLGLPIPLVGYWLAGN